MSCPCGNGPTIEECCGPYIEGERPAPTAEALMRSRYSAYATGAIDYVVSSHHPDKRDEVDRDGAEGWSKGAEWLGLEILETEAGAEQDEKGMVEFVARYRSEEGGAKAGVVSHRERSVFQKIDGRWFYVDGKIVRAKPLVRTEKKVGRNEPCTCGSGKKYKKCCG